MEQGEREICRRRIEEKKNGHGNEEVRRKQYRRQKLQKKLQRIYRQKIKKL